MLHLNYPPCHRAETYASVLSKHEILINKGVLNYFFKDDASTADLSEPFTKTLNPSEKEVAMILGKSFCFYQSMLFLIFLFSELTKLMHKLIVV